jgi:transcriptional regulator of acetoin/glycerol metabolism
MERLKHQPWPGNIRELHNLIERAMIVSDGRSLTVDLPAVASEPATVPITLEEVERKHIIDVLESVHWRISGERGAAEILGLRPTTLHARMKKLGISRQTR